MRVRDDWRAERASCERSLRVHRETNDRCEPSPSDRFAHRSLTAADRSRCGQTARFKGTLARVSTLSEIHACVIVVRSLDSIDQGLCPVVAACRACVLLSGSASLLLPDPLQQGRPINEGGEALVGCGEITATLRILSGRAAIPRAQSDHHDDAAEHTVVHANTARRAGNIGERGGKRTVAGTLERARNQHPPPPPSKTSSRDD